MKVMVIVKATPSSEAGQMPSQQLLADMGSYNEELIKAGIMKAGDGLKPSSQGVRVRFRGKDRIATDGPFAETKELVAGYWIWEVESMDQAVAWVKRCPNPMPEESELEIRPIFGPEDFGEEFTSDLREQEEDQRNSLALQQASVIPYLFFAGRCEEALTFYKESLGATIEMTMRFNESPVPPSPDMLQPGFENKIMHATFRIGAMTLMASDGCNDKDVFGGFRLALTVASEDAAQRTFSALSAGGKVDMPLAPTFFSPCYGMLTDKFGVGWMVMVPGAGA